MLSTIIGALVGVVLGGGGRALEAWWARRLDREALLSALVAEVEACSRLADHRGFLAGMAQARAAAEEAIAAGREDELMPLGQIKQVQDYFPVFHGSSARLGLLDPYHADRIVRFYTYAKAALENYHPDSPFQKGAKPAEIIAVCDNDMQLMITVLGIGNEIAGFRKIKPPAGTLIDQVAAAAAEPPLPLPGQIGVEPERKLED